MNQVYWSVLLAKSELFKSIHTVNLCSGPHLKSEALEANNKIRVTHQTQVNTTTFPIWPRNVAFPHQQLEVVLG